MIKSYLIVALCNLAKYKGHTLINVFGLAVGMTCCLLILFYVLTELSYDRHHENAKRIYRVTSLNHRYDQHFCENGHSTDRQYPSIIEATRFGPALKAEYAEILAAVRLRTLPGPTLVKN